MSDQKYENSSDSQWTFSHEHCYYHFEKKQTLNNNFKNIFVLMTLKLTKLNFKLANENSLVRL